MNEVYRVSRPWRRAAVAAVFVPAVGIAFLSTLARELGQALCYAYLEAKLEIARAKELWNE